MEGFWLVTNASLYTADLTKKPLIPCLITKVIEQKTSTKSNQQGQTNDFLPASGLAKYKKSKAAEYQSPIPQTAQAFEPTTLFGGSSHDTFQI